MPYIKAKSLNPQHGVGYHASFLGIADEALVKNDIVVATGVSGDRVKFSKANANVSNRHLGVLGIADHAAASGGTVRIVSHKIIKTTVNTSGSNLGAPVYLSNVNGLGSLGAGAASMVVGNVVVLHATEGKFLLAPAHSVGVE